jgi:membrane associated rhomboid family serine protease
MNSISLTLLLIVMTVLVSYQAFNRSDMKYKLAFHPASISEFGQWYHFLTSGFVHNDWQHLILNMYVFYLFGTTLESIFIQSIFEPGVGRIVFLLFYLSAIVVSDIPSFFQHKDNSAYSAVGASGATSALLMAYIMFDPWNWFIFPPLPGIILAIGYLWYSTYMGRYGNDLIAHYAHLWGAVYGILFMLAIAFFYEPALLDYFIERLLDGPRAPSF